MAVITQLSDVQHIRLFTKGCWRQRHRSEVIVYSQKELLLIKIYDKKNQQMNKNVGQISIDRGAIITIGIIIYDHDLRPMSYDNLLETGVYIQGSL